MSPDCDSRSWVMLLIMTFEVRLTERMTLMKVKKEMERLVLF